MWIPAPERRYRVSSRTASGIHPVRQAAVRAIGRYDRHFVDRCFVEPGGPMTSLLLVATSFDAAAPRSGHRGLCSRYRPTSKPGKQKRLVMKNLLILAFLGLRASPKIRAGRYCFRFWFALERLGRGNQRRLAQAAEPTCR